METTEERTTEPQDDRAQVSGQRSLQCAYQTSGGATDACLTRAVLCPMDEYLTNFPARRQRAIPSMRRPLGALCSGASFIRLSACRRNRARPLSLQGAWHVPACHVLTRSGRGRGGSLKEEVEDIRVVANRSGAVVNTGLLVDFHCFAALVRATLFRVTAVQRARLGLCRQLHPKQLHSLTATANYLTELRAEFIHGQGL